MIFSELIGAWLKPPTATFDEKSADTLRQVRRAAPATQTNAVEQFLHTIGWSSLDASQRRVVLDEMVRQDPPRHARHAMGLRVRNAQELLALPASNNALRRDWRNYFEVAATPARLSKGLEDARVYCVNGRYSEAATRFLWYLACWRAYYGTTHDLTYVRVRSEYLRNLGPTACAPFATAEHLRKALKREPHLLNQRDYTGWLPRLLSALVNDPQASVNAAETFAVAEALWHQVAPHAGFSCDAIEQSVDALCELSEAVGRRCQRDVLVGIAVPARPTPPNAEATLSSQQPRVHPGLRLPGADSDAHCRPTARPPAPGSARPAEDTVQFCEQFREMPAPRALKDIVGVPTTVLHFVLHLKHARVAAAIADPRNQFLLLHGEAGTGKTSIANAIAHELGLPFYKIRARDIIGSFVGESMANVDKLFATLAKSANASPRGVLVFIDELEGIFRRRDAAHESGEYARAVTAFLSQTGNSSTDPARNMFVVGATNLLHEVDRAVRNRFSCQAYIGLPNEEEIRCILRFQLKNRANSVTDQTIKTVAARCAGLSGRDIEGVLNEAVGHILVRYDTNPHTPIEISDAALEQGLTEFLRSRDTND